MVPSTRDLSASDASLPSGTLPANHSPDLTAPDALKSTEPAEPARSTESAKSVEPIEPATQISPPKLIVQGVAVRLATILMYSVAYCIVMGQQLLQSMASRIFHRLRRALLTFPSWGGWLDTAAIALFYGCIVLIVGFTTNLLSLPFPEELSREALNPSRLLAQMLPENFLTFIGTALVIPALLEELVFRALLMPRREERLKRKWAWIALALGLFVASYPFLSHVGHQYFEAESLELLTRRSFLALALLLGLGASWLYRRTGSIWSPVLFHWVAVVAWKFFGGAVPFLL